MGWTGQHATHYKNGNIDRKAECDAYFMEGLNAGHFKVEKSAMVGSTYYAAITPLLREGAKNADGKHEAEPIPEAEQMTYAVVFLTSVDNKDYFNFMYKDMDETMLPYSFDCPASILSLLSETDNEYALEWRQKCRERIAEKKAKQSNPHTLENLPVGSVIEFDLAGTPVQFEKYAPAYQFKRPFWMNEDMRYIPKARIPKNYKVISVG